MGVGATPPGQPGVAVIGCGLVGQKRARALGPARLVACADVARDHAQALALSVERSSPGESHGGVLAFQNWREALAVPGVGIVIVATSNDALAEISCAAIEAGKHVLVEKPAARRAAELRTVIEAAGRHDVRVRVGFNHRYHPAVRKARELYESGALGSLMYVRGRYGHGGRPGYEHEWRADPARSGGGELIDQGVHLIDLARWFLGDFDRVMGVARTYFWQVPVEDNGFMILTTPRQQVALLHASWTEWKNLFSFEIFGQHAALHVQGLGGSYGTERLIFHRMRPEMGPPETTIWEYPGADASWETEFKEFLEDIKLGRNAAVGLEDAYAALSIVEQVYALS